MVIDSNLLIRYLTQDDLRKARKVATFLKSGANPYITDVTFAEVYWVLHSFYKFPTTKICDGFRKLLSTNAIRYNTNVINTTLHYLAAVPSIGFIDAYTAAYSKEKNDGIVFSFDLDFDKVSEIIRKEP